MTATAVQTLAWGVSRTGEFDARAGEDVIRTQGGSPTVDCGTGGCGSGCKPAPRFGRPPGCATPATCSRRPSQALLSTDRQVDLDVAAAAISVVQHQRHLATSATTARARQTLPAAVQRRPVPEGARACSLDGP